MNEKIESITQIINAKMEQQATMLVEMFERLVESLLQKLTAINKLGGVTISPSRKKKTVHNLRKASGIPMQLDVDSGAFERKRQRLSPYENVDKALLSWIKYARSQNAPISWNVLKEKSLEFANELGESSFVANNGWLQRFNSRHNLSFKNLCGEAADFDSSSLKEWKDVVLRDILARYECANVFNVDECGLFLSDLDR
ncbi:Tigger transposable element-derived protein 6 [Araneus ventricosus]|uniref:Tigger transposable element-derived protein 6 n=1 Tax=Araneus ventricosus TaxID=182803 RepID=A0A4Y2GZN2_ARAVE|nr:Tigger transposable element-derived protein 6 [Araneus ventricosus]